jgi:hypothetical protein
VASSFAWQPAAGIVGGIALIALGVASSRGAFRRWESWYRDPAMPFYLRNGAFALVPFGLADLGLMGAALTHANHAVSSVGAAIFVIGVGVGVAFMIRPPQWVKPTWARTEDGRRADTDD